MSGYRRLGVAAVAAVLAAAPRSASAWGCQGHQLVALVAEAHLDRHALDVARRLLQANPIDPRLHRSCAPAEGADPLVDGATWADDHRDANPGTAPWHYVDIPRGAPPGDLAPYCTAAGCVTSAIRDALAILGAPDRRPRQRADALRLVIHLVGDLHQPLHAATNNDRGGNCVPVIHLGREPRPRPKGADATTHSLHGLWDVEVVRGVVRGRPLAVVAAALDAEFRSREAAWQRGADELERWAWESHAWAEAISYGALPIEIPVEAPLPPGQAARCSVRRRAGPRTLRLEESIGPGYESAAEAVVREQVVKAGVRLAAILNQLWPRQGS